MPSDLRRV